MTTHQKLLDGSLDSVEIKASSGSTWAKRHCRAWDNSWANKGGASMGMESALVLMIKSLAYYADAHFQRYESRVGQDGVLGPAWADSVRNALTLLNGELGNLDAGTLDGLLRSMLKLEGFDSDA